MRRLHRVVFFTFIVVCQITNAVLKAQPFPGGEFGYFTYFDYPDHVAIIGCSRDAIGKVDVPESINGKTVTGVGGNTFNYCQSITEIVLPTGLSSIGDGAFVGCESLRTISLDLGNRHFTVRDDVLFDADMDHLIVYPSALTLSTYQIPEGVSSIADEAFDNCSNLRNIELSDSLKSIGYGAFRQCVYLANIDLPDGLVSIERFAFDSCVSLAEITLPAGITSIGGNAFYNCSSLRSVTVDSKNLHFTARDDVLFDAKMDRLIVYPSALTASVYRVPAGVISIAEDAFSNCSNLKSIELPDSLDSIDVSAFGGCGLTNIAFPIGLSSIGYSAFAGCINLRLVLFKGEVPELALDTFTNTAGRKKLYYPDGASNVLQPALDSFITEPLSLIPNTDLAYLAWRIRYFSEEHLLNEFVSGEDSDPDYDGHSNLFEYLAMLDPLDPDSRMTASFGGEDGHSLSLGPINKLSDSKVQKSSDLESWNDVDESEYIVLDSYIELRNLSDAVYFRIAYADSRENFILN